MGDKVPLSQDPGSQDVPVAIAVPYANPVYGAVTSGPTAIGGMNVVGRTQLPGQFQVMGDRYSVVNRELQPGESYQGESGVMMYMSNDVQMQARFAGWRMFSGEGLAKLSFTNRGSQPGFVGLSPNMPMAIVIPFDVGQAGLNCKRGAYMSGDNSVRVFPKPLPAASCAACCCGGMPPLIQHLSGSGIALLNAGGTVVQKQLGPGERILVDSDSIVAFTDGVGYDVRQVGNFLTCCFGGEGCFNTELSGPGTVYLQSLSYEKLIRLLVRKQGNAKKDTNESSGAPLDAAAMER